MRLLLTCFAGGFILLLEAVTALVPAMDRFPGIDASAVEDLLREALAEDELKVPSLLPFENGDLIELELVDLEQGSPSRWHATIEMLFDFGPPPPAVLGFERTRRRRYALVLKQVGKQLELLRITSIGRVRPLPAKH